MYVAQDDNSVTVEHGFPVNLTRAKVNNCQIHFYQLLSTRRKTVLLYVQASFVTILL